MTIAPYTPEQADALQELVNVAMGQAGALLATMLDAFVTLSVPRSRIVSVDKVAGAVSDMIGSGEQIIAVRQAFFNTLRGEALVLFGPEGCLGLADLMGHEGEVDACAEEELLLDVSNVLVGAVLNGLGEQLETEFSFSPPSLMAVRRSADELLAADKLGWSHALLIEVNFALDERGFRCHLVVLMPEESIELMRSVLAQMLDEL
jgi:chemotaxis protein CheC